MTPTTAQAERQSQLTRSNAGPICDLKLGHWWRAHIIACIDTKYGLPLTVNSRSLCTQEVTVSLVVRLLDKRISQFLQKVIESGCGICRYLQTDQDFTDIRPVITVMKERNVPIWSQATQEVRQSAESFREFCFDQLGLPPLGV